MFKQLVITFAIISLFGMFAVAQDKPETTERKKGMFKELLL